MEKVNKQKEYKNSKVDNSVEKTEQVKNIELSPYQIANKAFCEYVKKTLKNERDLTYENTLVFTYLNEVVKNFEQGNNNEKIQLLAKSKALNEYIKKTPEKERNLNLDNLVVKNYLMDVVKKLDLRCFKIKHSVDDIELGKYNGISPYQAASKAFSEYVKKTLKNDQNSSIDDFINKPQNFFLVEATKEFNPRLHEYTGTRIKLDEPVSYTVGNGVVITKKYKNIIRKVKKVKENKQVQSE